MCRNEQSGPSTLHLCPWSNGPRHLHPHWCAVHRGFRPVLGPTARIGQYGQRESVIQIPQVSRVLFTNTLLMMCRISGYLIVILSLATVAAATFTGFNENVLKIKLWAVIISAVLVLIGLAPRIKKHKLGL